MSFCTGCGAQLGKAGEGVARPPGSAVADAAVAGEPATLGVRCTSLALDLAVLLIPAWVLLQVAPLVVVLYVLVMEGVMDGQTVGKKLSGTAVRRLDNKPVGLTTALLRMVTWPADLFVGWWLILKNPRKQRLGDMLAGTQVVKR